MKRLKNGKSSLGPKATVPHKAQTKSNKKTSSKKKYLGKKEHRAPVQSKKHPKNNQKTDWNTVVKKKS
jgi:hypothetical protein